MGLAVAADQVILTQLGQPALLYLVPCTLGVVLAKACRMQQLRELYVYRVLEYSYLYGCHSVHSILQ